MRSHFFRRRTTNYALLIAIIAAWGSGVSHADEPKPFLSPLFTDNMVLQRGMADPIWGWTAPGKTVTVKMNGKSTAAVAGPDGKWMAKIGPFTAGGPYTLTLSGPQAATLQNVMVGDVWLCSGQSNMEFGVGNLLNSEQTITAANNPNIRLFTVAKTLSDTPQALTVGQWQPCTPDTIKSQGTWNGFSAVAYFFGRDLQQDIHIPIGLLLSSWGGTPAEAWVSEPALRQNVPEFGPQIDQLHAAHGVTKTLAEQSADWYSANDPGTKRSWQLSATDDSAWKTITQPGLFQDAGIPELSSFNGTIWFRRTFDLPTGDAGKAAILHLLADDNDTTWVNGVQVGATAGYNTPRSYPVPAALLKPVGNVIAVRVLDTGGKGGIWGDPAGLNLEVPGGGALSLTGLWHYHTGVSLTQAAALPIAATNNPNLPTVLYNGLISPLTSFGIKGALWYQGESNEGRAAQYQRLLPALIGDWRQRWGEGNFPFLIVQLAGWQTQDNSLPEIREAQMRTAQAVPNTGIATAVDIGDAADIHPKNKQEVGRRLVLVAEAKAYGKTVSYYGPIYRSLTVTGSAATVTFSHVDGGLTAKDSNPLTGFEIAAADGNFVAADARIVGETVVVSSALVPHPASVRYAWSGYPSCSLYSKDGLPAFPFDTGAK